MGKMVKLALGALAGLYALLQLLVVTGVAAANPQGMQARTSTSAAIAFACVSAAMSIALVHSAFKRPPDPPSDE